MMPSMQIKKYQLSHCHWCGGWAQSSPIICLLNLSKKEHFWRSLIQQFNWLVNLTPLWPRDEKHSIHQLVISLENLGCHSYILFTVLCCLKVLKPQYEMYCVYSSFHIFFVKLVLFIFVFARLIVAKLARGNETFHKIYLY